MHGAARCDLGPLDVLHLMERQLEVSRNTLLDASTERNEPMMLSLPSEECDGGEVWGVFLVAGLYDKS